MARVINFGSVINVSELEDGQIAEVKKWFDSTLSPGDIIQKNGSCIFILGKDFHYPDLCKNKKLVANATVMVLPKNTIIML